MNKNIEKVEFFIETMPLFQRGDIKIFDRLIRLIQLNPTFKNLDLLLEIEIDKIELEDFVTEFNKVTLDNGLTTSQIKNTREEILETYFLEKGRFDRYYAPLGIKKEALAKIILKEEDELKTANELVEDILESLKEQREIINSKTTGRDNFSLVKYNKEIVSRATRIYNTLKMNGIELNEEVTLEGVLAKLAKELLETYNEEIVEVKHTSEKELMDLILPFSKDVRSSAVVFNNIKNDLIDNSSKAKALEENNDRSLINSLPNLRGGINAGSDFEIRIFSIFKRLLLDKGHQKTKTRRTKAERENFKRELSANDQFKQDLRQMIMDLLKVSDVKTNASTKSLFINGHEVLYGNIGLDKEIMKSFLNMTLSTEDDNLKLLKVIANLENVEAQNVLSIINDNPAKRVEEIEKELKQDDLSENKAKALLEELKRIEKVQLDFQDFKDKYGENIMEEIGSEFEKLFNYGIYIAKEDAKLRQNPNVQMNIKEKYSHEQSKIYFRDLNEINEFLDVMLFMKSNIDLVNIKTTGLTSSEVKEIKHLLENFAVKSFHALSEDTLIKILENQDVIVEAIRKKHKNKKNLQQEENKEPKR